MIYAIFGLGEKTKYSAVLLELGLLRIRHIIARQQINYMSSIVWEREGSVIHDSIMEEFKLLGAKSSLAMVDELAASYGFNKISLEPVDKKVLKRTVRMAHDSEVWFDCFRSPIIEVRPYFRVRDKSHFGWEKLKSKALLALRTGSLKFKVSWRIYNVKRGIGVNCVNVLCPYEDSFQHAKQCLFYNTVWKESYQDSEELTADYLLKLNRERIARYRLPII